MNRILVLNSGSSSLKYALFNVLNEAVKSTCATGIVEKIGEMHQTVKHTTINECNEQETGKENTDNLTTHKDALKHVLHLLGTGLGANSRIKAVGHRVVHGGEKLVQPHIINKDVENAIEAASLLAPLHNPANLAGIKTSIETFDSSVKQVAVFDTAFHATTPEHAFLYGVPYRYYKDHGVRKYGFHGISHQYIMKEASRFLNKPIDKLNLITCHLGAGASMCCIKNGQSVDSSMGMTPLAGLLMQTRSGDLDPGVIFYLIKQMGMTPDDMENILLKESGWYGLSGCRNARELEDSYKANNDQAIRTVHNFVHRIKSYLGTFYWNLEGQVDAVVFSGGVGENWTKLRELCFEGAKQFGFEIDKDLNQRTKLIDSTVDVSSKDSNNRILVIPTNEELNIATITLNVINSCKDRK